MTNKEINQKVAEFKKRLQVEEAQRRKLVDRNLDYAYLEELIKRCDNNRDLIIEVTLKDGTFLKIKTDRKPSRSPTAELFEQYEEV